MSTPTPDIERKVRQLDADVQAIYEMLARIEATQRRQTNRLDMIDSRLEGVDSRLEGVEGRLEGVEGRLEGVEGRLEGMDASLQEILRRLPNP